MIFELSRKYLRFAKRSTPPCTLPCTLTSQPVTARQPGATSYHLLQAVTGCGMEMSGVVKESKRMQLLFFTLNSACIYFKRGGGALHYISAQPSKQSALELGMGLHHPPGITKDSSVGRWAGINIADFWF